MVTPGDLGEFTQTRIEFDLTGLEQSISARFKFDDTTQGETGGKDPA
jgi:hypothetical protein